MGSGLGQPCRSIVLCLSAGKGTPVSLAASRAPDSMLDAGVRAPPQRQDSNATTRPVAEEEQCWAFWGLQSV